MAFLKSEMQKKPFIIAFSLKCVLLWSQNTSRIIVISRLGRWENRPNISVELFNYLQMFLSVHILSNFMTCPSKYSHLSQLKYLPIYSIKFCNTVICSSVAAFLLSQQKTETSHFYACANNHFHTENTNGK